MNLANYIDGLGALSTASTARGAEAETAQSHGSGSQGHMPQVLALATAPPDREPDLTGRKCAKGTVACQRAAPLSLGELPGAASSGGHAQP